MKNKKDAMNTITAKVLEKRGFKYQGGDYKNFVLPKAIGDYKIYYIPYADAVDVFDISGDEYAGAMHNTYKNVTHWQTLDSILRFFNKILNKC